MGWVRLDDGFSDHPKIDNLSDGAFRLHVAALGYVARNLTDGVIPEARLARLVPRYKPTSLTELLDAPYGPIWHAPGHLCDRCPQPPPRHFTVHDYLAKNPTREQEIERRQKRADAGRIGGQRSGASRVAEAKAQALAEANASANGRAKPKPAGSNADEPRPVPVPVPVGESSLLKVVDPRTPSSSSVGEDDDPHTTVLAETWKLLAARLLERRDADMQAKGEGPIPGPARRSKWRASTACDLDARLGDLARIYLRTDPDLTAKELADVLDEAPAADIAAEWNREATP